VALRKRLILALPVKSGGSVADASSKTAAARAFEEAPKGLFVAFPQASPLLPRRHHRVRRVHYIFFFKPQRFHETLFERGQKMQRPAEKRHVAADRTAARKPLIV
jgi:hypothetical protein